MNISKKIEILLHSVKLPKREIQCYGSQITIDCLSYSSCEQWAIFISQFARVRKIIKSLVEKKSNQKKYLTIYRLYAVID